MTNNENWDIYYDIIWKEIFVMDEGRFSHEELRKAIENESGHPLSSTVKAALRLAFDGHRGQLRNSRQPNKPIPFIVHPVGTARLAIISSSLY